MQVSKNHNSVDLDVILNGNYSLWMCEWPNINFRKSWWEINLIIPMRLLHYTWYYWCVILNKICGMVSAMKEKICSSIRTECWFHLYLFCRYVSGYKNRFQNFIKYLREMGDEVTFSTSFVSRYTHVLYFSLNIVNKWIVEFQVKR